MSTSRGIHAESLENRSGSASRPERSGASPRPPPAPPSPPPPNRRWSPRSSSRDDVEREQHPVEQRIEGVAQQVAPSCRARSAAARRARSGGRVPARAGARPASRRWARSAAASASYASSAATAASRGSGGSGASSTRARSGRAAGFSLATRMSSSSSSRTGVGRSSTSGNSSPTASRRPVATGGAERLLDGLGRARPSRLARHELRRLLDDAGGRSRGAARAPRARRPGRWARPACPVALTAAATRRAATMSAARSGTRGRWGPSSGRARRARTGGARSARWAGLASRQCRRSVGAGNAALRPGRASARRRRTGRVDALERPAEELEARGVELVGPLAQPLRPVEARVEAQGHRLARQEDDVGLAVDLVELGLRVRDGGHDLHALRAAQLQHLGDVLDAALGAADEPHLGARRQGRDLVDELHVAGADDHRDHRHPAGDVGLGLVGVERRRRDEVVVVAVEALRAAPRAARPSPRSGRGTPR